MPKPKKAGGRVALTTPVKQEWELVEVTVKKRGVKYEVNCDYDGISLYYETGPGAVRWVFSKIPDEVRSAKVEMLDRFPAAKYPNSDADIPVLTGFDAKEADSSSTGSHIKDWVMKANPKQRGYFFYVVTIFDKDGKELGRSDPGGTNDPSWPPTVYPPF